MIVDNSRRAALFGFGSLAVGAAALAAGPARATTAERVIPPGASELADLTARLGRAPRRRDFKAVPMILSDPELWD
ncbi:MAG TPA: transcriptional initiation protein Tat, partial [Bradyrhizobium sp.]|nr:transcriptional initiation protein Tat [Bradyrhizobium sp.]